MRLLFKIQLVEILVFTEARGVKTTQAAASVASNVATAMPKLYFGLVDLEKAFDRLPRELI